MITFLGSNDALNLAGRAGGEEVKLIFESVWVLWPIRSLGLSASEPCWSRRAEGLGRAAGVASQPRLREVFVSPWGGVRLPCGRSLAL